MCALLQDKLSCSGKTALSKPLLILQPGRAEGHLCWPQKYKVVAWWHAGATGELLGHHRDLASSQSIAPESFAPVLVHVFLACLATLFFPGFFSWLVGWLVGWLPPGNLGSKFCHFNIHHNLNFSHFNIHHMRLVVLKTACPCLPRHSHRV